MNFHALATGEFLSGLDDETAMENAYQNLSNHVQNGEELDDDTIFWQPFENHEAEELLEMIDNLASLLERVYDAGRESVLSNLEKL